MNAKEALDRIADDDIPVDLEWLAETAGSDVANLVRQAQQGAYITKDEVRSALRASHHTVDEVRGGECPNPGFGEVACYCQPSRVVAGRLGIDLETDDD